MDDRHDSEDKSAKDASPAEARARPSSPYTPEELVQLDKQERLGGWLVLFFAGAALATAALAFYLFGQDAEQNDEYVRIDRPEEASADDTPFVWGEATPDAPDIDEGENTPSEARNVMDAAPASPRPPPVGVQEQVFNFPGPPEEPAAQTFAGPPAGSVDRETSRALRNGEAELWREKGERGYVLVSDPVVYGTRECRQVSYTRFENGGQAVSPSTQWCRVEGRSRWRPDSRGPE